MFRLARFKCTRICSVTGALFDATRAFGKAPRPARSLRTEHGPIPGRTRRESPGQVRATCRADTIGGTTQGVSSKTHAGGVLEVADLHSIRAASAAKVLNFAAPQRGCAWTSVIDVHGLPVVLHAGKASANHEDAAALASCHTCNMALFEPGPAGRGSGTLLALVRCREKDSQTLPLGQDAALPTEAAVLPSEAAPRAVEAAARASVSGAVMCLDAIVTGGDVVILQRVRGVTHVAAAAGRGPTSV